MGTFSLSRTLRRLVPPSLRTIFLRPRTDGHISKPLYTKTLEIKQLAICGKPPDAARDSVATSSLITPLVPLRSSNALQLIAASAPDQLASAATSALETTSCVLDTPSCIVSHKNIRPRKAVRGTRRHTTVSVHKVRVTIVPARLRGKTVHSKRSKLPTGLRRRKTARQTNHGRHAPRAPPSAKACGGSGTGTTLVSGVGVVATAAVTTVVTAFIGALVIVAGTAAVAAVAPGPTPEEPQTAERVFVMEAGAVGGRTRRRLLRAAAAASAATAVPVKFPSEGPHREDSGSWEWRLIEWLARLVGGSTGVGRGGEGRSHAGRVDAYIVVSGLPQGQL
ncbi:hypothetical protein HK405_011570 [Cladochytrium tenue]|nr:hypothetical protein HK405_011570 [Cladochytrium tenue]